MSPPSAEVSALPVATGAAAISRSTVLKILATVVAIAAGVSALIFFSLDASVSQYMFADEAVAKADTLLGKRIDVHGFVVKGSIEQRPGTLDYRFVLETRAPRPPAKITVVYSGIVPDTFKSESEVVAKGNLDAGHVLQANDLTAKCPTRYVAKDDITKEGTAAAATSKSY